MDNYDYDMDPKDTGPLNLGKKSQRLGKKINFFKKMRIMQILQRKKGAAVRCGSEYAACGVRRTEFERLRSDGYDAEGTFRLFKEEV